MEFKHSHHTMSHGEAIVLVQGCMASSGAKEEVKTVYLAIFIFLTLEH